MHVLRVRRDFLHVASPPPPADEAVVRLIDDDGRLVQLDEVERAVIRHAIAHLRGQMSEVARQLGMGRSTLYRKLDGFGSDQKIVHIG